MLTYTVKNFLYYLSKNCKDNDYILEFSGTRTKKIYRFKISKNVIYFIKDNEEIKVEDIYDLRLVEDNFFKPHLYKEIIYKRNGEILREVTLHPDFPTQIYIELFKLLKERVHFVFKVGSTLTEAYYVDRKVLFIEEDDKNVYLKGTNLYHLQTTHSGYQILYIANIVDRSSYAEFADKTDSYARAVRKRFVKYRYDM